MSGIVKDPMIPIRPSKADLPIDVTESGIVSVPLNPSHPMKTYGLIVVMLVGIFNDPEREIQLAKAESSIF